MTLDELLENLLFSATLERFAGPPVAGDDRAVVLVHIEARLALIRRYCPPLLVGAEGQRMTSLYHSLRAQLEGEQKYLERSARAQN